jgi:polysaccharide export outer membrane protein
LNRLAALLFCCLVAFPVGAQQSDDRPIPAAKQQSEPAPQLGHVPASADDTIGPDDSITISVLESDEISKTWRVTSTGDIVLPLAGQIHVAGLTADQVDQKVTEALKQYIHTPHVTVYIAEFRSQVVTVTGAVHRPGTFQTTGSKTLWTVLTMAGGLENVYGANLTIARQVQYGVIPLPGAHPDGDGTHSVIELRTDDVANATTPASNLMIRPNDVISVSMDDRRVYIIGEVLKPGVIELVNHDSISMMQVLAVAGGLSKLAAPKNTEIMRQNASGLYERVGSIDLKKLQTGRGEDRMLTAGDIVVVPASGIKAYTQMIGFNAVYTGFSLLTRY